MPFICDAASAISVTLTLPFRSASPLTDLFLSVSEGFEVSSCLLSAEDDVLGFDDGSFFEETSDSLLSVPVDSLLDEFAEVLSGLETVSGLDVGSVSAFFESLFPGSFGFCGF